MSVGQLTTMERVKRQVNIAASDAVDDAWLVRAIYAVSEAIENATSTWLAPRTGLTRTFDGAATDGWRTLRVPHGLRSLAYLGIASSDQPDDGSGTYTDATAAAYLRGRLQPDWPAMRVELATGTFPADGYARVLVTGDWGFASVPERVADIATIAVVRAFRARADGNADIAITGMDGAMRILRRIAPAELDELRQTYAVTAKPKLAAVAV